MIKKYYSKNMTDLKEIINQLQVLICLTPLIFFTILTICLFFEVNRDEW